MTYYSRTTQGRKVRVAYDEESRAFLWDIAAHNYSAHVWYEETA